MSFVVGFVGLPSAGKSTMVNSLIGKRYVQTGTCRTTKSPSFIGKGNYLDYGKKDFLDYEKQIYLKTVMNIELENYLKHDFVSDDGIEYSVIDFPGMSDSENSSDEKNFNEITFEGIKHCNLVCWVTDINSAFLTSHEKNEYEKLLKHINNYSRDSGKLIKTCIVLSKYDYNDKQQLEQDDDNDEDEISSEDPYEITTNYEETTIENHFERVENLFPNEKIIKYNAYGRILYGKNISKGLKKLLKDKWVENNNVNFYLKWAFNNFKEQEQELLFHILIDNMKNENKSREIYKRIYMWKYIFQYIHFLMISNLNEYMEFCINIYKIPYKYSMNMWINFSNYDNSLHLIENRKKIHHLLDDCGDSLSNISEQWLEYSDLKYRNGIVPNYVKIFDINSMIDKKQKFDQQRDMIHYFCMWMSILDKNSIAITRLYLMCEPEGIWYNVEYTITRECDDVSDDFNKIFEYDMAIKNDNSLLCSKIIINEIKKIRNRLWKDNKIVSMNQVIEEYRNNKIGSIFSPIHTKWDNELIENLLTIDL